MARELVKRAREVACALDRGDVPDSGEVAELLWQMSSEIERFRKANGKLASHVLSMIVDECERDPVVRQELDPLLVRAADVLGGRPRPGP